MRESFRDLGPAGERRALSTPGTSRRDVVHGDVVHGDKVGRDKIIYGDRERPAERRPTILVMSANPAGQQLLRLDEERRAIDRVVRTAGGRLAVRSADALRLDDLQPALARHRPVIAHFSGHGSASNGILVVDDNGGGVRPVPPDALEDLFRILSRYVRCVVLNACYTDVQAAAIATHVPCVVGMHHRVSDRAAIRFAGAFYQAIAYGEPVRTAFDLGRNSLRLHRDPDAGIPRLLTTDGPDADRPLVRWRPAE